MDEILTQLAEIIGKRKSDLKKTATAVQKKTEIATLKGIIPDHAYNKLVLLGVCKRYEIPYETLDKLLGDGEVEEIQEEAKEIKETIPNNENKITKEVNKMGDNWNDIFGSVPERKETDDTEGGFKKYENLKTLTNLPYKLKLEDPSALPYQHEGTGNDGKDYTSYAINVILIEGVEDGPFKNGEAYKLWLNERAFANFVRFWRNDLGLDSPDDREFVYKKAEKISKKTGRTYHLITFK
ncbi:MAG: hypothetical protein GY853_16500 [PVC group bacterium]|nr:hypothetical protein [PVC group bacterium]